MTIHQFHPKEAHIVAGVTWQEQLNRAMSEREVIGVTRDFVATFSPHDIAALPEKCRPGKFMAADDITAFAFDVVRYCADEDGRTAELVHRLANFFSHASIRLSQLLANAGANEAQDDRQTA